MVSQLSSLYCNVIYCCCWRNLVGRKSGNVKATLSKCGPETLRTETLMFHEHSKALLFLTTCCFAQKVQLLDLKIARAQPVQRDSQMTVHCLDSESYLQSSCWSLHINEVCQKGQKVQQLSAKKYGWANKYQTFCLSDIYIWDLCMTYLFELIQGHIAKRTVINFTRPSQPTHLSYIQEVEEPSLFQRYWI